MRLLGMVLYLLAYMRVRWGTQLNNPVFPSIVVMLQCTAGLDVAVACMASRLPFAIPDVYDSMVRHCQAYA
jgi:hypothetical protein